TQYIPPVPAADGHPGEAATQYMPPVPGAGAHPGEAATQFIPPVPATDGHPGEAATQYIPPVPGAAAQDPAAAAARHAEAATQYMAPVPAGPVNPATAAEGFDSLFRTDDGAATGHTQQQPPARAEAPVPRRTPPPAPPQNRRAPQQQPPPPPQHQQYAPPPPPPPAGRRISPVVIAAGVFGLAVAGLGVGALLGHGKAQNNDPGAVVPAATGSAKGSAGDAPVDPARPQAVQLDKLLADSNDSRAAVIKAVDDIKDCKNLGQAGQDLRDAARQREELVTRLQELKVDLLPNHARLSAALTKAWKASAAADDSYADWADDMNHDKGACKDGKAKSTDNAADGNRSSGEATKSKESAAALWNSIASKYGLPQRDKSEL
ncbi:hypothetical protein ACFWAO_18180, partial [Streptomyces sp. NPDC059981]